MSRHGNSLRRLSRLALLALLIAAPALPAHAMLQPDETLADPALEARAHALGDGLRCMVCQSESVNDSPAGIARDIRVLIREQIEAGQSDAQIVAFLKARYGDAILMRPPLQADTLALWFAPFVILAAGAAGLAVSMRGRGPRPERAPGPRPD